MNHYNYLWAVYDELMDNVPYEKWAEHIIGILKSYGIEDGLILDLGCGSGVMSEILSSRGYELIGIDASQEMLGIAMDKKIESGNDILYLCQDMREFELYGTVQGVICTCDSLNYLLETQELVQVFKLVNNYLDPGGIFIFDSTTPRNYEKMGDCTIAENREDCSFIWENSYDVKEHVNQYDLTLFIKEEDGRYNKLEETHLQRGYEKQEIIDALEKSGLKIINTCNDYSIEPVQADTKRICFIAKEQGKDFKKG